MTVDLKQLAELMKNLRKIGEKWYLAKPEDCGTTFMRRLRAAIIVLLNRGVVIEWR